MCNCRCQGSNCSNVIKGVKVGLCGLPVGEKTQNVSNSEIHAQLVHSHGFDLSNKHNSNNVYI